MRSFSFRIRVGLKPTSSVPVREGDRTQRRQTSEEGARG